MTTYSKPKMICLFLHQSIWNGYSVSADDNLVYCPKCKRNFYYPSKKDSNPVYDV